MGNLFDLILILVPIITVAICVHKGFLMLLRPFRKILAFFLAWTLKGSAIIQLTVGKLIKTDKFKAFLTERVDALWRENIENAISTDGVSVAERFDSVFGFAGKLFSGFKDFCISLYDKSFTESAESNIPPSEQIEAFVKGVTDYVANTLANFITMLIGFALLYIIFSVAFNLLSKTLNVFFKHGILGVVNKFLGGLVGICQGLIFSWLLSFVFVLLIPLITNLDTTTVTNGFLNLTEWFYSDFLHFKGKRQINYCYFNIDLRFVNM